MADKKQKPQDTTGTQQAHHPGYPTPPRPPQVRLAEAYVPWQVFSETYSPEEGLRKGTIFPELYRPYRY